MKKDYNSNRQLLSERLKTETPKTPIQEVRPVETPIQPNEKSASVKVQEAHVNFWLPKELMQRVKVSSATTGKTIKQIGIEAFELYLTKHK